MGGAGWNCALLHQKRCRCLRSARTSSCDKHMPDIGKNYEDGYSTPKREAWETWPPWTPGKTVSNPQILLAISSLPPSPWTRSISWTFIKTGILCCSMTVGGVGVMVRYQSRKRWGMSKTEHCWEGVGWQPCLYLQWQESERTKWAVDSLTLHGATGTEDVSWGCPFPTIIQPAPSSPTGWYGTLSQPQRCIQLSLRMEPSKRCCAWKPGMAAEWSFPSMSWLNDELLGGNKGDFTANLANLAEGFFKLQFLEYI